MHHAAREQLFDDQAGFNGLAEADFIAKARRVRATDPARAMRREPDTPAARCGSAEDKANRRIGWKPTIMPRARKEKIRAILHWKCRLLELQRRHFEAHRQGRKRRAFFPRKSRLCTLSFGIAKGSFSLPPRACPPPFDAFHGRAVPPPSAQISCNRASSSARFCSLRCNLRRYRSTSVFVSKSISPIILPSGEN